MDPHPKQDLDARMSNPEEEEDQYESGEEEDDMMDNEEDSSGVNPPSLLSQSGGDRNSPSADFYRRSPEQEMEDRKRLERELLAQKEMLLKREEQQQQQPPLYLGGSNNNGRSSKSTTPSPSSPPQTQYLYAANYPFAAAAAAALLTPSHMAAAAAAQASAVAAAQSVASQLGAVGAQAATGHHPGALSAMGGMGGGESSTGSATPTNNGSSEDQSKYTFEEQFKQLYEISDDPRRREFLDDLFNFMQKRGTPVNRVPIMAKQVLDLYELYRLVVTRGGLVEVINKKIWREIVKGLNLPSSITSAAFTLRTQYMRYLYAYECDREKFSTAEELQAAIDGNRREGRRSSYGPYGEISPAAVAVSRNSQHPPLSSPLSLVSRHVNGHGSTPGGLSSGRGSASPLPLAYFHNNSTSAQLPLNLAHQENGLYGSHGLSSAFHSKGPYNNGPSLDNKWDPARKPFSDVKMENGSNSDTGEEDNCNSIPSTPNPMVMPQQEALNLEVSRNSSNNNNNDQKPLNMKRKPHDEENSMSTTKRLLEDERFSQRTSMPQAHIKISSNRGPDGRLQSDTSLAISMEVNGILYQGVLYASPNHRNRL